MIDRVIAATPTASGTTPRPGTTEKPPAPRPVGLLAAFLAVAVSVTVALMGQRYAIGLASHYLSEASMHRDPIRWEALTFQRAALEAGDWLPLYGSSELYSGNPYNSYQLFAQGPTGFRVLPVGNDGVGNLFDLETLGALGHQLQGKRLAISLTPTYFLESGGMDPKLYAGNFSPEIADLFVFDAPLSLPLKEDGSRRMLAYPDTLKDQPLLRLALAQLAEASRWPHLLAYAALMPAGRLDAWIKELQDAYQTVRYIHQHPAFRQDAPPRPSAIDWQIDLRQATAAAAAGSADNPFGIANQTYLQIRNQRPFVTALQLYCAGASGMGNGGSATMNWTYPEWTDFDLQLRALRELGAMPLVIEFPLPGASEDYMSPNNRSVRTQLYQHLTGMAASFGFPLVTFASHDEDLYFVTDLAPHPSARGALYADRALDVFWHTGSPTAIQSALTMLDGMSPSVTRPPASPASCAGVGNATLTSGK